MCKSKKVSVVRLRPGVLTTLRFAQHDDVKNCNVIPQPTWHPEARMFDRVTKDLPVRNTLVIIKTPQ